MFFYWKDFKSWKGVGKPSSSGPGEAKRSPDKQLDQEGYKSKHYHKHIIPNSKINEVGNEQLAKSGVGNSFCLAGHIGNTLGLRGPVSVT
jgi:hypothetical protein